MHNRPAPRMVHRPTPHTAQLPKITKSSNLTTKTPQNEEKEYIFVIYALGISTAQILRGFWKLWKNCAFNAWAFEWSGRLAGEPSKSTLTHSLPSSKNRPILKHWESLLSDSTNMYHNSNIILFVLRDGIFNQKLYIHISEVRR